MAVHFGYNYKAVLIKNLQDKFKKEIDALHLSENQQDQLDDAETMIVKFFENEKQDLMELEDASGGMVAYREYEEEFIVKLAIGDHYLQFSRKPHAIEIETGVWNEEDEHVESIVSAYVIPSDKKCRLKKVGRIHDGSYFDENAINSFMREVFSSFMTEE